MAREDKVYSGRGKGLDVILNLGSFIKRHWLFIAGFIFIFPLVLSSIMVSIETQNPIHGLSILGKSLILADQNLGENIYVLDNIQLQEVPESRFFSKDSFLGKLKFWYINYLNHWWAILTSLWVITIVFRYIYKFWEWQDETSTIRNIIYTILIFGGLQFILNLIYIIISLMDGGCEVPICQSLVGLPDSSMPLKVWFVIKAVFPFNGIISLFSFIIKFFVNL